MAREDVKIKVSVGLVLSVRQGFTFIVESIHDKGTGREWARLHRACHGKRLSSEDWTILSIQSWIKAGWVKPLGVAVGYGL